MKIVVLDGKTTTASCDFSWEWLSKYGEYTVYDRTPKEETVNRAKDADIIITNKTVLSKDILEQCENVKFIALLSTGYNVVDCEYAAQRGIPVSNIPSYSTEAVAQMTFALILEITNAVALHSKAVHDGEWCRCEDFCFWKTPLTELSGKTLGIVGFGKIGKAVAQIARAFSMEVLVYAPRRHGFRGGDGVHFVTLEALRERADIITFHCPLNDETEKMVNADFISSMKDGAVIINTARGQIVDEQALYEALESGKISAAGVDVLSVEPPKEDNPLLKAKNCYITPHISWAGYETRARLLEIFKGNIEAFVNGSPRNVVNMK